METKLPISAEEQASETQRFMTQVYGWMSAALAITGGVAMYVASSVDLIRLILGNMYILIALVILQFVCVGFFSFQVNKMSVGVATATFFVYSVLTGLVFSVLFVVYTAESIASTFFITAGTFCVMSIYGYTTKSDLTRWGSLLFMGLIGLILASVVNMFMNSSTLYWATTYFGVVIFVGLTAYDTQKIKNMNILGNEGTDEDKKEAIMGALILYLDFANLFLYLLRILGRRK